MVVGTLDVNRGAKLPAEELVGRHPAGTSEAVSQRAYLSNVCVMKGARRQVDGGVFLMLVWVEVGGGFVPELGLVWGLKDIKITALHPGLVVSQPCFLGMHGDFGCLLKSQSSPLTMGNGVQGVAGALVMAASEVAAAAGVEHLYVHVVADNMAAITLYCQRCGFEVEKEETEAFARQLNRPRRLLLHRCISS
jgi:hypothetical protein